MTDLVDQFFPPIHKKWMPEYTDFNYWKIPVSEYPLPDLSPPSPTLSARSEISNKNTLAKLRNFRLLGSRANGINGPPSERTSERPIHNGQILESNRDPDLRQMSSFERLVSGLRRGVSPSSISRSSYTIDSDSESEADDGNQVDSPKKMRRRSMTSMPGSLDDLDFTTDDEDVHREDQEHYEDGEYDDDGVDEYDDGLYRELSEEIAMDEDLLAATEMKKIPFL